MSRHLSAESVIRLNFEIETIEITLQVSDLKWVIGDQ